MNEEQVQELAKLLREFADVCTRVGGLDSAAVVYRTIGKGTDADQAALDAQRLHTCAQAIYNKIFFTVDGYVAVEQLIGEIN